MLVFNKWYNRCTPVLLFLHPLYNLHLIMKKYLKLLGTSLLLFALLKKANGNNFASIVKDTLIIRPAIEKGHISADWKAALKSRMIKEYIDSLSVIKKVFTNEEKDWLRLINSKAQLWNSFRDSLAIPFSNITLNDTIYILLGCGGADDGFTYQLNTVCFDLTALQQNYGDAALKENDNRMDRLFAHEYTHLLHKKWAVRKNLSLATFRDSILWECIYEGIGMYRSLNPGWLPANDILPAIITTTLKELYPVFTNRMIAIYTLSSASNGEKQKLNANLSRGPVNKKWGALPVAIWLALEAKGDHRKLIKWIEMGPAGIMILALKYLDEKNSTELKAVLKRTY